jgi:hypothetical protein
MGYSVANLKKVQTPLVGFTDDTLYPEGVIEMRVEFRQSLHATTTMVEFLVVNTPSAYNTILGWWSSWWSIPLLHIMLFWEEKLLMQLVPLFLPHYLRSNSLLLLTLVKNVIVS